MQNDGFKGFIAQFVITPLVTGVEEQENANGELSVYPNPSASNIWVDGNVNAQEKIVIEIVDVLGKVVYTETIQPANHLHKSIDIANLANGVYFLRVQADENVFTDKFIIQR